MSNTNLKGPKLIMIRGLWGSGKSTIASALQREIGNDEVVILDPDLLDYADKDFLEFSAELSKEGLDKEIHPFRWLRKKACDGILEGKVVIWGQPFTVRGVFDRLVKFLEDYAHDNSIKLPVLLVEINVGHELAQRRIAERKAAGGHGPSDDTFARRVGEFESYADGFKTVIVQGQDDVQKSVSAIIRELEKLTA